MSHPAPAWQRWSLLVALFALGLGYVAAFAFFLTHSEDFVAKRINAPAREHAMANPLGSHATLAFTSGGAGLAHLGSGWHPPDNNGSTWSNWPDAWLFVALPSDSTAATLHVDADAYLAPSHSRVVVTLTANAVELKRWTLDEADPRLAGAITVPPDILTEQPLALRFHIDTPTSPWRERAGDDTRPLGIRLRSIEMISSQAP